MSSASSAASEMQITGDVRKGAFKNKSPLSWWILQSISHGVQKSRFSNDLQGVCIGEEEQQGRVCKTVAVLAEAQGQRLCRFCYLQQMWWLLVLQS